MSVSQLVIAYGRDIGCSSTESLLTSSILQDLTRYITTPYSIDSSQKHPRLLSHLCRLQSLRSFRGDQRCPEWQVWLHTSLLQVPMRGCTLPVTLVNLKLKGQLRISVQRRQKPSLSTHQHTPNAGCGPAAARKSLPGTAAAAHPGR